MEAYDKCVDVENLRTVAQWRATWHECYVIYNTGVEIMLSLLDSVSSQARKMWTKHHYGIAEYKQKHNQLV